MFHIKLDQYSGELHDLVEKAISGNPKDVDMIFSKLTPASSLVSTRRIDFALSLVESESGKARIQFYLFNGTQIQRNYASLYFNRTAEWPLVKRAFDLGLIDAVQAFAR